MEVKLLSFSTIEKLFQEKAKEIERMGKNLMKVRERVVDEKDDLNSLRGFEKQYEDYCAEYDKFVK